MQASLGEASPQCSHLDRRIPNVNVENNSGVSMAVVRVTSASEVQVLATNRCRQHTLLSAFKSLELCCSLGREIIKI